MLEIHCVVTSGRAVASATGRFKTVGVAAGPSRGVRVGWWRGGVGPRLEKGGWRSCGTGETVGFSLRCDISWNITGPSSQTRFGLDVLRAGIL